MRRPLSFLIPTSNKSLDDSIPPNADELSSYSSIPNSLEVSMSSAHPFGSFGGSYYSRFQQQQPRPEHLSSLGSIDPQFHRQQQQQYGAEYQTDGHYDQRTYPHPHVLMPPSSPYRDHVPKRPRFGVEGLDAVENLIQNIISCGGCVTTEATTGRCANPVSTKYNNNGFASKPFMHSSKGGSNIEQTQHRGSSNNDNGMIASHSTMFGTAFTASIGTTPIASAVAPNGGFYNVGLSTAPSQNIGTTHGVAEEMDTPNSSLQTSDTSYRIEADTLESSYASTFLSDTGNPHRHPMGSYMIFPGGGTSTRPLYQQQQQQEQYQPKHSRLLRPQQQARFRVTTTRMRPWEIPQQSPPTTTNMMSHNIRPHHEGSAVHQPSYGGPATRPMVVESTTVSPSPTKPHQHGKSSTTTIQRKMMTDDGPPRPPDIRRLTLEDAAVEQQMLQNSVGGLNHHHRASFVPATTAIIPESPHHHSISSSHGHNNNRSLLLPQPEVLRSRSLDFLFPFEGRGRPTATTTSMTCLTTTQQQNQQQYGYPSDDVIRQQNESATSAVESHVDLNATYMTH